MTRARQILSLFRKVTQTDADFHPKAVGLDAEPAPLAGFLIFTIAFFLAAVLIWAGLGTVEQVATAQGVVRPFGRVKIINHPEGGRVVAVHVQEGDRVDAGQALVELDASLLEEEITRLQDAWYGLAARSARLEAEATRSRPEFPAALHAARPDLEQLQTRLFESRSTTLASDEKIAARVVEQRASDVEALTLRIEELQNSLALLKKQERSVNLLVEKGYFPELRHLSIQRQLSESEGTLAEARERLIAAFAAFAEAKERQKAVGQKFHAEALDHLAAAQKERDATEGALAQRKSQREALVIRAPAAGIVQNLRVTSVGQAIGGNDPLMNIVPTTDSLIVEARVQNRDIGYVALGQAARVKFRTYDFLRFGSLDGRVEQVAANAVTPAAGSESYFTVVIRTERAHLGKRPDEQPVQPGMEVDVDLRIGEKSILSYLTDRMFRTSAQAFQER